MPNEVNILITATDKASAVLNKATGGVKGLNQSFQTMTGISLTAAGGIAAVVAGIKTSIDFTMKYADEVSNLSRNIGATTQEASRLIQVSDDVKISTEQLSTAMKGAITKGYAPTIDGLMKMSDAYLAIHDPIARSKYLVDTFGRAGLEMGRLMELGSAGIRKAGESAKMILSPADIQKMKDYYAATDSLGDSFDQMKVSVGLTTAGPLKDFFNTMSNGVDVMGQLNLVNTNFMMNLHDIIYNTKQGGATEAWMKGLKEQAEAAAMPVDSWATSWRKGADALKDASGAAAAAAGPIAALQGIDIGIGDKIATDLAKVNWSEAGGAAITDFKAQIDSAFNEGTISEEAWNNMSGQAYVAAQQVDVAVGTITGDEAAQNIAGTLNVSLTDAKQLAGDTRDYIDNIKSKEVHIRIVTEYITSYDKQYLPSGWAFGGSAHVGPAAFGKTFKIPAAFGFEGFPTPMGTASGGERVTVTPEGQNQEMDLSEKTIRRMLLMMRDVKLTSL
jgi:hypothetical protein